MIDLSMESHEQKPLSTNKDVVFAAFIAQQETKQMNHQQKMMLQLLKAKIKSCQKDLKMWKSLVSPAVLTGRHENAEYIMNEFKLSQSNLNKATQALDNFVTQSCRPFSTTEEVEKGRQQKDEWMNLVGKALSNTAMKPAAAAASNGNGQSENSYKRQRIGTPCSSVEIPDNWNTPSTNNSTSP